MKEDTFALYKAKYEEVYGVPLAYFEEESAEETKTGGNEDKCCLCG